MTALVADAVLFDLDGVLVDSTPAFRRHWYQWADEHGIDGPETFDVGLGIQTADHKGSSPPTSTLRPRPPASSRWRSTTPKAWRPSWARPA
jgi:hypothetical protein